MSALRISSEGGGLADPVDVLKQLVEPAVRLRNPKDIVRTIQTNLANAIRSNRICLSNRFLQSKPTSYARRLLISDFDLRYTVVAMTWAPGQMTPIHDHAGIWCVEGVVLGEMTITRYRLEMAAADFLLFTAQPAFQVLVGSSSCSIPPDEYYVLANLTDSTAVTVHVLWRRDGSLQRVHSEVGWMVRAFISFPDLRPIAFEPDSKET
jgi:predicted metal-dependent enzyme (double-stranded beta helix superfamily)